MRKEDEFKISFCHPRDRELPVRLAASKVAYLVCMRVYGVFVDDQVNGGWFPFL